MGTYVFSIKVGLVFFPILALIITIPFMISQYHKYGSIPYLKSIIVYSFILYLLEAYLMVILPLPKISAVKYYSSNWFQLIPFNFVTEIANKVEINILSFSSIVNFFKHPLVYQLLFNIFLTIPFGIYLRYYFKRSLKEIIVLSFILSLFFEITQISGLYGLYPRPYRLFDVDDLMSNTLGGAIGYFIAPLFTFFLPTKEELDNKAIEASNYVSTPRKLIANIIDFSIIYLSFPVFINSSLNHEFLFLSLIMVCYYIFTTFIFKGYTIGKFIVRIKIVNSDKKRAKLYQLLIRYQIIYILFFEVYFITYLFDSALLSLSLLSLTFIIYLNILFSVIRKKKRIYERLSKTEHISTKL